MAINMNKTNKRVRDIVEAIDKYLIKKSSDNTVVTLSEYGTEFHCGWTLYQDDDIEILQLGISENDDGDVVVAVCWFPEIGPEVDEEITIKNVKDVSFIPLPSPVTDGLDTLDKSHPCYKCTHPGSWRCWEPALELISIMAQGCHCGEYPGTGPEYCLKAVEDGA